MGHRDPKSGPRRSSARAPGRAVWLCTCVWAVLATLGAAAPRLHATLLRSDPAPGAVLDAAPTAVRLWFSEGVAAAPDAIELVDPSGQVVRVEAGVNATDHTLLEGQLQRLGPGTWSVRWRVISDDGHVVAGSYSFSLGGGVPAPPSGTGAVAGGGPEISAPRAFPVAAARALHLVGFALALGPLGILLLMGGISTSLPRRMSAVGLAGAAVLLLAAAAMLLVQASALAGSLQRGLSGASLAALLRGRWGMLWLARLIAAGGLLAAYALARRAGRFRGVPAVTAGAGALLLLLATAANGHALVTPPLPLSMAVQTLHLAATGLWLGGCASLWMLLSGPENDAGVDAAALSRLVRRFSRLALTCVLLLVLTGLYQTWAHVGKLALLTSTDYGRTLLVKLGVIALIAVPAGVNRWVMKPRLAAAPSLPGEGRPALTRRFMRLLGAECALGLAILAAAGTLAALPPARGAEAAAQGTAAQRTMAAPSSATPPPSSATAPVAPPSWTVALGTGSVDLSLDPAGLGSNVARLTLRDVGGRPSNAADVRLRLLPPTGSAAASSLQALAREDSGYRAVLMLGAPGEWTLRVLASGDSVDVRVPVSAQPQQPAVQDHDVPVTPR